MILWTVAHQLPLSMGFSRQEYWSGLPFPSPGDLPDPVIKLWSPALQADSLPSEPTGKPSSVQFSSVSQWCLTLSNTMDCSTPGFPVHHHLPELAQTHFHQLGNAIQSSHPLSSPSSPASIFPSIRVFSNESILYIWWPEYWSFSFSISLFNEYSGLICFRNDWLDCLAVQGTLKSLLQNHNSKASIPWSSALFMVQFSHPYMTIGKIIALTRWIFVGKVMSLLFNILSRLVITFLPRSN